MHYPDAFQPVGEETIRLPSGFRVAVPKVTPTFRRWAGPPPGDTYGNKPVVTLNGEPLFAELAILRLFQTAGWEGVWLDMHRNTTWVGMDQGLPLPPLQAALLDRISRTTGIRAGCFDVFCWRDGQVLFAESKRKGRARVWETQRRWLSAGLQIGLVAESFLIVEWCLAEA